MKYFKVSGSSMAGLGIQDGDVVKVDFDLVPVPGDVVISFGDVNIIKSFYQLAGGSGLYSTNGRTLPFKRTPDGVVVEVLRNGRY